MSKNSIIITSPVDACDLNFFRQGEVVSLDSMPAGF
jgi:hypothetical protein